MKFAVCFFLISIISLSLSQLQVPANQEEQNECIMAGEVEGKTFQSATKRYLKCLVKCTYTDGSIKQINSPPSVQCDPSPFSLLPTGCCPGDFEECDGSATGCFFEG